MGTCAANTASPHVLQRQDPQKWFLQSPKHETLTLCQAKKGVISHTVTLFAFGLRINPIARYLLQKHILHFQINIDTVLLKVYQRSR